MLDEFREYWPYLAVLFDVVVATLASAHVVLQTLHPDGRLQTEDGSFRR